MFTLSSHWLPMTLLLLAFCGIFLYVLVIFPDLARLEGGASSFAEVAWPPIVKEVWHPLMARYSQRQFILIIPFQLEFTIFTRNWPLFHDKFRIWPGGCLVARCLEYSICIKIGERSCQRRSKCRMAKCNPSPFFYVHVSSRCTKVALPDMQL